MIRKMTEWDILSESFDTILLHVSMVPVTIPYHTIPACAFCGVVLFSLDTYISNELLK